ncbi:hypothetical protein L1887_35318 [Cichorium endivia]|nr:hypothetical protein L1887_35318 [Cichorium endivia]
MNSNRHIPRSYYGLPNNSDDSLPPPNYPDAAFRIPVSHNKVERYRAVNQQYCMYVCATPHGRNYVLHTVGCLPQLQGITKKLIFITMTIIGGGFLVFWWLSWSAREKNGNLVLNARGWPWHRKIRGLLSGKRSSRKDANR